MQRSYKAVDAFNAELQAVGAWVFAGGLHPPDTATVVRAAGRRGRHHRRPVRRDQGAARRLLGDRGPRPRRRARLVAARGSVACGAPGRGPAVPGRARGLDRRARRCRRPTSSGSSGESPAARSPPWSASSATSTSPRRRSRRPSSIAAERWPADGRAAQPRRLDHHHGPQPAHRPAAPRVASRPRPPGRRPPGSRDRRPSQTEARTRDRRPAAADLHLLPPGAGRRGPGRADAAAARRAADPGDRPRLPGPRADDGPAPGPGQAQDPRRRHPVPGPARRRAARPAAGRARRRLPGLQRGLHRLGGRRA